MPRLLLLDGNSLAYRAFFALPEEMATSSGQVTNAVFGFTSMLINLLKDQQPDGVAVAFDRPEPTFRHATVATYKAGRREAPEVLRQQIGLIRQVLEALQIPMVDAPGYEADDVLATLATQARDRGDEAVVVTGDRDCYQLVEDPHIRVLYNRRGVSDYSLYDEAGIRERTGVEPSSYVAYAALRGDQSDNLPGVPGVGEKTAARLVRDYGTLDSIFQHLTELSPKLRESLALHEDQVWRNAKVMPLVRDVALDFDIEALGLLDWDPEEVHKIFSFLEMRTLWERLSEIQGNPERAGRPAGTEGAPRPLIYSLDMPRSKADVVSVIRETPGPWVLQAVWSDQPGRSPLSGLAFASLAPGGDPPAPDSHQLDVVWLEATMLTSSAVTEALGQALASVEVVAHQAKEVMRSLLPMGVDIVHLDLDASVAAYLLDPAEGHYLLEDLASRWAGVGPGGGDPGSQGQLALDDSGGPAPEQAAAAQVAALAALAGPIRAALRDKGLASLYHDVERPLVRVLARMEVAGVGVDVECLRELSGELTREAASLDREIQELAGTEFRVNSTQQLRVILYDKLGLTPQKRTKTGYSTDATSLERLRGEHPIIEALLRYREVEKLRSTYGEGLLAEVAPDGRIHATFNQTVARTGRLSSDQPNLHNIPVRSEEGRRFRQAFVPAPGTAFLVADYNQVELRVIAHLSSDPGLVEAFRSGLDIHTTTAARIFGVSPEEVTIGQRSRAKMVSYGLAYGMEAYGLSQRLAIPVEEAQAILDAFFAGFPKVRSYMEVTVAEARARGYTETIFGRRRYIPELSSPNHRVRQAGERQAMNAGIQGLAADLFKVALDRLDSELEWSRLHSRLVLQVHDEVILEVPPSEREAAATLTRRAMEGAADLDVPLTVDVAWGSTWAEAKEGHV